MSLIRTQGKWPLLLTSILLVMGALLPTETTYAANLTAGTAAELIAAINTANANNAPDTITLTSNITLTATNNTTATGPNGLPSITSEITLAGDGFTLERSPSAPIFRLIHVAGSGNLTVQDATLNRGDAGTGNGGGIYNSSGGTLTMTNSTVDNNAAAFGGGIYSRGALALVESTVSGNAAQSEGGGIYTAGGLLTMADSTVRSNTAASGGGIFNIGGGMVTITNSIINSNTANIGGGILNGIGMVTMFNGTVAANTAAFGGGIYNIVGDLAMTNSTVIVNSTVTGNSTAEGNGGGIYNTDGGTVTVTNGTVTGNEAVELGEGGGIYNTNGGTLTVTSSTVGNNSAQRGGGISNEGGTLTVTNSTVSANQARNGGGGIYNFSAGTVMVTNSTVSANSASFGGGIYNEGGTLTVRNSTVRGNSAVQGSGGGIYNISAGTLMVINSTVSGNASQLVGGGIVNFSGGILTVRNSTVSGNASQGNGGGIANSGSGSTVTVINSIVAGNTASVGNNCEGTITASGGGNFSENIAGDNCPTSFGNIVPGVHYSTTLAPNGGPTQTLALFAGSPAINQSNTTPTDQRGVPVQGGSRDSGAFEFGASPTYPTIAFASAGATYEESDGTVIIPLTFTGAQNFAATATFYIVDVGSGTATSGTDYTAFPLAGISLDCAAVDCSSGGSVELPLTLAADGVFEPEETINLQIVGTNGFGFVSVAGSTFTATIAATDFVSPADAVFVINRVGNDPTDGNDDANDAIADVDNDGDIDADDVQQVIDALGTAAE